MPAPVPLRIGAGARRAARLTGQIHDQVRSLPPGAPITGITLG
ncbi:hypothetical protein [Nocardioides sp. CER19]|nr:hypothetical protein [Nocardioides sp. CER19]MDH2416213.1 hypothetical protein [Nocardioides sp. CER19]